MEQIDYKEKFEQALERARQFSEKPYLEDSAGIVEYIFPELKESEDEKIRKALMQNLKERFGTKGNMGEGLDMPDVLAWLEKQEIKEHDVCDTCDEKASCVNPCPMKLVEQKPTDKVEPIEGEFPYDNPADTLEGEIDNIWRKVSCGNRFTATKEGFEEVIRHFINFVKQKPAWSEEDEKTINNICHIIRQYDKISKKENQPCWYIGDCLLWMQNIKNKVIPQPKQEWSEEDYIEIKRITGLLEGWASTFEKTFYEKECKRGVAWLKSLKDRVQPQPRQEWSEEDNAMLISIENILIGRGHSFHDKEINWLKSLRPQSQWKPSDMELEVLRLAAEKDGTCLMGLYEQLKKLREE